MRPIVSKQNNFIYPLNELFGAEAHVRLLRVLASEVEGPLTASDAAERVGLTPRGAVKALNRLVKSGFVNRVGGGRKHQFILRQNDPLIKAVFKLFQEESKRYDGLIDNLKRTIEIPQPSPISAWINKLPENLSDSLIIVVIHNTRYLSEYMHNLRKEMRLQERKFEITIELRGYTKADIPILEPTTICHLYGVSPLIEESSWNYFAGMKTQGGKEARLFKLGNLISSFVEKDTSLVMRAKKHVRRLLEKNQGMATGEIEEWKDILESYSTQRLSQFLISNDERSVRLRPSCPLFAVLNEKERETVINLLGEKGDTRAT